METKNENDRMAIVSAPNRSWKAYITNEDLVELGFPDFLVDPFFDRKLTENQIYRIFWKDRVDAEVNFYNALYTLVKLYQKHTGRTMTVSHSGLYVYLNNEEVFHSYLVKKQRLDTIRLIVRSLLATKYNEDFEALEKEFARTYAEEKAKIESDGKEIFNLALVDKLPPDKKTKHLNKLQQIIKLLQTEEFSEKQLFFPNKIGWFGEPYYLKPLRLRLKEALKYVQAIQLSQNQNILILRTTRAEDCAIKLKENEKQEILRLNSLFENEL